MFRYLSRAALIFFTLCLTTQNTAPSFAEGAGETPIWSNDFVDTIGENTHCSFARIGWADCNNPIALAAAIRSLGVRHFRDSISDYWKGYKDAGSPHIPVYTDHGTATPVTTFYEKLAKEDGAKFDFVIDLKYGNHSALVPDVVAAVPSTEALELGGNEPDSPYNPPDLCPPPNPNGLSCWAQDSVSEIQYYSAAAKAAGVKRIGPSVEFGQNYTCSSTPGSQKVVVAATQCPVNGAPNLSVLGDESAYLDANNLHHYAADQHPGNRILASYREQSRSVAATNTTWITEAGYGTGKNGDNDERIAKYEPRIFAEHYYEGVRRTYQFEMLDQTKSAAGPYFDTFGLLSVQSNATLKPKLQYEALRSLIEILKDSGSRPTLVPVKWSINGGDSKVHHILTQRQDGTYQILLWVEGPDPTPDETVKVGFCSPGFTVGTRSQFTPANGQFVNSSLTPTAAGGCEVYGPLAVTDAMQIYRFGRSAFQPAAPRPPAAPFQNK